MGYRTWMGYRFVEGMWLFARFLFVPRWGKSKSGL